MRRIFRTSTIDLRIFDKKKNVFIFFLILAFGMVIGSVSYAESLSKSSNFIFNIINQNYADKSLENFFSIFIQSFISGFLFILPIYFLGVCAVGSFFMYFPVLFFGIIKGTELAYFYLQYGIKGVFGSILFFIPQNLMLFFLMLFALLFSLYMSDSIKEVNKNTSQISLKVYNIKYLFILIFNILISILDSILIKQLIIFLK